MRPSDIPKQTNQLSDYSKIKYFLQGGILVLVIFLLNFFPFLRKHNVLALVVINVPLMLPAASKLNLLQVLRFVLCTFRFRLLLLTWTRTEVVHLLCFVGGNAAGA
jgi:hypothetical protein